MKSWLAGTVLLAAMAVPAWAADTLVDAARSEATEAALGMIESGADVDKPSFDGTTALHWAAHHADVDLVRQLLKAGAEPNVMNDYGAFPLSEAALTGNAEIVELLLTAGADPNFTNPEGETALMVAARTGAVQAAERLIDHGADVNARESWGGQTALMWAAAQSQPEMVKLLIDRGADIDARSKVRQWKRKITAEPRPKDLNKGGFTPLMYAAREDCIACVEHLAAAGADLDMGDPDRVTALNLALINLHFDLAAVLIEAGADVDKWDLYGRTPLYNAIDMNTLPAGGRADIRSLDQNTGLDIARMLLERGANPNIQLKLRPPYRNVPFDRGGDAILSNGATPLLRAAKASDNEAVTLLLDHGALVDLANSDGITPFMAAAGLGHGSRATRGAFKTEAEGLETLSILLDAGADVNRVAYWPEKRAEGQSGTQQAFNTYPYAGQTALHGAAKKGWTEIVKLLIDNGAELQLADAEGHTPLDLAMARYEPSFLEPEPEPFEDTGKVLRDACRAQPDCHLPQSASAE